MKKIVIVVTIILLLIVGVVISNGKKGGTTTSMEQMEHMPETSGLHIMADGSVMDGLGNILPNATIQKDGNILMDDGRVFIPMADFR